MGPFFSNLLTRVAHSAIGYIVALFLIGGADRIAQEYNVTPAQRALSVIDTAVVQQRTLVLAPGSTLEVSGTVVNSGAAVSGSVVQ